MQYEIIWRNTNNKTQCYITGRNIFPQDAIQNHLLQYEAIGRNTIS